MPNDVVLFDLPVFHEDIAAIVDAPIPWGRYRDQSILVTGAGGMIPMYVVGALLAANDRYRLGIRVTGLVRSFDKAKYRFGSAINRADFNLIAGDVAALPASLGTFSTVFHGASPARPSLHSSSPVTTLKANVLGTINTLDLLVRGGGESFVLLSSSEIYGAVDSGSLIDEETVGRAPHLAARAAYSEGKRVAETALVAYQAEYGIRPLILRYGHIYGPGLALDDGRVQADFLADVVRGRDITMMSAGVATRTYTYVGDAVLGTFYAHLLGDEIVYNVADADGNVSIRELAETFAAARPAKALKLSFTNPDDERSFSPVQSLGLDSSRLRSLGWNTKTPLGAGVSRMIRSYEDTDNPRYTESENETDNLSG